MIADCLRAALAGQKNEILPLGQMRAAAVLVPLRRRDGRLQLILTRRTEQLPHHAGEISFPGGGVDTQDQDDWATALRETREEVGIDSAAVEYLGRLNDCYSIHNYRVSCHVALLPADLNFALDPGEIAELIELPLAELKNPQIHHQEHWPHKGRAVPIDFYTLNGYVIWGMTASILKDLLARIEPLLGPHGY
jgi:8-oxo-dGTP pyrophosphatase MutT (NUDIX family)